MPTRSSTPKPKDLAAKVLKKYPVLREKIEIATGFTGKDVDLLFAEVIKYLFLASGSSKPLSPSYPVDRAWHEFILHTVAYRSFCDDYLSAFVNHIPGRKPASANDDKKMRDALTERFGPLEERFWPQHRARRGHGKECDGNPHCLNA